jgi:transposase-like protein
MQIKREKYTTTIRGNMEVVIQPLHVVLQAVRDLESGEVTVAEIMERCEVKRATVMNWLKKHSGLYNEGIARHHTPKEAKRLAVRQLESGALTRREIAEKYNVDVSTVSHWKKQYSCKMQHTKKKEFLVPDTDVASVTEGGIDKILQGQLEELQLKVYALETMIDLAEKAFQIDIRKKCGTKQ